MNNFDKSLFNKSIFERMRQLRAQVLDEDLAVEDPDEHAEIWIRYTELCDLCRQLGIMEDFHRFLHYKHYLNKKEEAHHETVRPL